MYSLLPPDLEFNLSPFFQKAYGGKPSLETGASGSRMYLIL
jgi:hypothetical protein